MALTPRGEVSYNVQTAVDRKHHLIVDQEVTNEVLDNHQLFTMAQKTKQMLGQNELQVVADMGYYNHEELKKLRGGGDHNLCLQTVGLQEHRARVIRQREICL